MNSQGPLLVYQTIVEEETYAAFMSSVGRFGFLVVS